jgi:PAS domain S-box-containing protein
MPELKDAGLRQTDVANGAFYRAIAEEMQDAVYVRGTDRDILYMNPAAEKLTGWSFEEALKIPCHRVFGDPGGRCNDNCPIDPVVLTGKPTRHMEGFVETCEGKNVPVEVSVTPLPESAGVAGAVVIVRDISRLHALEQARLKTMREFEQGVWALKQSEARFRDFASMSVDWLWETDADHRFTFMIGKTVVEPDYFLGRRREDIIDVKADSDRWAQYFEWIDYERPYANFVYPLLGPDGRETWVSISGKPIYDANRLFNGYRGVGRDITSTVKKK